MMSGSLFARRAASFWHSRAPTSEAFVRKINTHLYTREFAPLTLETSSKTTGYVNEVAFDLFCLIVNRSKPQMSALFDIPSKTDLTNISDYVWRRKSAYGRHVGAQPPLHEEELADIQAQLERFKNFFGAGLIDGNLVPKPIFPGCGIIDDCEGDIVVDDGLFELKAGRRGFRSADIHQLLIYVALHMQKTDQMFRTIGLFNPRLGISYIANTDMICFEIAGRSAREFIFDVVAAMSDGGLSR